MTYSPVCCSYNAGTTTLLLRLPNAACGSLGDCISNTIGDAGTPVDVLRVQSEGSKERSVVDIFGRIHDLGALQLQCKPYWGAADRRPLGLTLCQGHQPYHRTSGPVGSLAQIDEAADSYAEESPSNSEPSKSTLSSAELKQHEEAYGLRNFINSCLMLSGSRRLSGGRRKQSRADAGGQLKDGADAAYSRGSQFLQWRGRFPKGMSSGGGPSEGGSGSSGCTETDKMSRGGYRNQQNDICPPKERLREASRLCRRRSKDGSPDSGLANVASTLSMTSPSLSGGS